MKLVVGLGNPGPRYAGTRHNVGWEVLALLAGRAGGGKPKAAFGGELLDVQLRGERTILLAPHTYMNKSGESVLPARDFYRVENQSVLVVCDDFNLPHGRLRLRTKGSAGGQKGLADIIRRLGTEDVPRLRIGIGPVPDRWDPADFVLGKFTKDERKEMDICLHEAADAVMDWAGDGIETAMNRWNVDRS